MTRPDQPSSSQQPLVFCHLLVSIATSHPCSFPQSTSAVKAVATCQAVMLAEEARAEGEEFGAPDMQATLEREIAEQNFKLLEARAAPLPHRNSVGQSCKLVTEFVSQHCHLR